MRREPRHPRRPPRACALLSVSRSRKTNLQVPGVCRGRPGGAAETACVPIAGGTPPTNLLARPPRARLDARLLP
ncbi:hypothetical protein NDU88_012022 [Pleurodeles waltl]|uniref:Uncharacterized protein n=1 Tax=Pleurodeles waltl TaxID=8319 RepID=A0AAV7R4P3_PLEWA|nr:hypothetical protein NDU88_012022 [Pleurodeles waltl]